MVAIKFVTTLRIAVIFYIWLVIAILVFDSIMIRASITLAQFLLRLSLVFGAFSCLYYQWLLFSTERLSFGLLTLTLCLATGAAAGFLGRGKRLI